MRVASLVSVAIALTLLCGCAGYMLGPTNGLIAGAKTIQIRPFSNQTFQPRLGDAMTTALRQQIQRDGTYRLATHGDADVIVTGTVVRYRRHELSFVPNDVLTVRDYRVSATAELITLDAATGHSLTNTVTGYTLVRVGSDLTSSERQALPLLADDLAKKMASLLVDGGW